MTAGIVPDVKILSSLMAALEASDPALVRAIERRDFATALTLIRQGADLGAVTLGGVTPLEAAADAGHAELVRELLDRGARPGDNSPALHIAARRGRLFFLSAESGEGRVLGLLKTAIRSAAIAATVWGALSLCLIIFKRAEL